MKGLSVLLLMTFAACAKEQGAPVGSSLLTSTAPVFSFDSLDARRVSSDAFRGRTSVMVFATTWDLGSQAQVAYLVKMAEHDSDRVNYAMVALQDPSARELVEQYVKVMHVPFPVAIADAASVAALFGDVQAVPTVVVLAPNGTVTFRGSGVIKSEDLRTHM